MYLIAQKFTCEYGTTLKAGHVMCFTDRFNTRVMISQIYCIRKGYQRYGHIITAHIASLHIHIQGQ